MTPDYAEYIKTLSGLSRLVMLEVMVQAEFGSPGELIDRVEKAGPYDRKVIRKVLHGAIKYRNERDKAISADRAERTDP